MKKKIISIVLIGVFLLCLGWFITNNEFIALLDKDKQLVDNQSEVENQSTGEAQLNNAIISRQVDDSQIIDCKEECEIKYTFSDSYQQTLKFAIGEATISRKLKPEYQVSNNVIKSFESEVMDENGTILSDGLYYVYVPVHVRRTEGDKSKFLPNDLTYVMLNEDSNKITDYQSKSSYNGITIQANPYYLLENDGKGLITYMKIVDDLKINDVLEYEACYIVPEELIDNQTMCLRYPFGIQGEITLKNKEQRYMKINITCEY